MAQVGIMLDVPEEELSAMTSGAIAEALESAAAQVRAGSFDGDYRHNPTGLRFKIRTKW